MNRYFIKKIVGACCFVCIIVGGFVLNVCRLKLNIDWKQDARTIITNIESEINEQVFARYAFIDLFGIMQKAMGKHEMNDFEVVQDEQGFLHYTYFGEEAKDTSDLVKSLVSYRKGIKNKKTKFLYTMTPDKNIPGYTTFSKGMPYNYANETASQFLKLLEKEKIATFDFREHLEESQIASEELFYKTDHHWRTETAFWAFGCLLKELKEQHQFPVKNYKEVTDIRNYNQVKYMDSFVGSMGRKNGVYYSGVDDFTLIYPKFATDYEYHAKTGKGKIETYGSFDQSLLCMLPFYQTGSRYDVMADKYASYLYGNQGIAHIKNKKVKGPKVLIVKDSFMLPLASYLSTVCSDIYLVDTRYYDKSVLDYTNSIKDLDYVMVAYNPQDLTEEFFKLK